MNIRDAAAEDLPAIVGIFAHDGTSVAPFEAFDFKAWARFPKVAELDGIARDLLVLGLGLDD